MHDSVIDSLTKKEIETMNWNRNFAFALVLAPLALGGLGCSSDSTEGGLAESPAIGTQKQAESVRPDAAEIARRKDKIRNHFKKVVDDMPKEKTTVTRSGKVIDWVRPESQIQGGQLSSPPSAPTVPANTEDQSAKSELLDDPQVRGPAGSVPVVRFDVESYLQSVEIPPASPEEMFAKMPPPAPASNNRYYVSWQRTGTWFGAGAAFNVWNAPGLSTGEDNIAQLAVFTRSGTVGQSVEAGKIQMQSLNGDAVPHLFVYYTTNNWGSSGDWRGGYNRLQQGFIQVGTNYSPGIALTPTSTRDGSQYSIYIEVRPNSNGDWWVWVGNEWMGYYPRCKSQDCTQGTLFSNPGLRDSANTYDFYGEIFDASAPASTFTDMGSGSFASEGWGRAAYIRSMRRFIALSTYEWLTSSVGALGTTDANCYSSNGPFFNGGTGWENYYYYGGPGRDAAACR